MDIKKIALFAAGTLFGSAGFKLLSSKDAKKVYTQNRWGDAHNYDLAINAALGRETCVKMILDAAAAKEKTLG